MSRDFTGMRSRYLADLQATGERHGYYLRYKGKIHWIAETRSEARWRLERVCARVLDDDNPHYSVWRSLGRDVDGKVAWTDFDHTDELI